MELVTDEGKGAVQGEYDGQSAVEQGLGSSWGGRMPKKE